MAVSDDYIAYILDQLKGLGRVLVDDELYLKVDDRNRSDFERRGLKPFTFAMKNGRRAIMGYYPVPADVLDDTQQLHTWAHRALTAALGAKGASHP